MGGSLTNESGKGPTSPPGRGGRGRGRGNYSNETRRPTLIHRAEQEPMDANRLNASLKATQELHRSIMIQHCLRSWSEIPIGHGPSPVMEGRMEEKREETSEQVTIPQASSREMPQPNIKVSHLLRVGTTELDAQANEEEITKGDETNRLESNIRETSTGPTVVKQEQLTITPALPVIVTTKPGPKHLQDPIISSSAAGTAANQHSPPPQQSRGAGRDKVKITLTFATPSRSKNSGGQTRHEPRYLWGRGHGDNQGNHHPPDTGFSGHGQTLQYRWRGPFPLEKDEQIRPPRSNTKGDGGAGTRTQTIPEGRKDHS